MADGGNCKKAVQAERQVTGAKIIVVMRCHKKEEEDDDAEK